MSSPHQFSLLTCGVQTPLGTFEGKRIVRVGGGFSLITSYHFHHFVASQFLFTKSLQLAQLDHFHHLPSLPLGRSEQPPHSFSPSLTRSQVPSISPLDRALALAALQQLSPEAALRAALRTLLTAAIIPEVEALEVVGDVGTRNVACTVYHSVFVHLFVVP